MQVLNRLGKLPLNRALTLIKAISKKKEKVIMSERSNFIDGAKENGITEEKANELFELILKFAGYGFNKAHSTRYAIVAYQSAWFKRYYPKEFLAATLTYEHGDTEKVVQYMQEADRMGVTIAPPNINSCDRDFTVDGDQVRFGMAGVKGVGAKAVDAIIEARNEVGEFTDLYHFCENVDLKAVNRSTIEALIKCGAFDGMGAHRAAMVAAVDHAINLGQSAAKDRKSGQMNFFEAFGANEEAPKAAQFPNVEPWSDTQLLAAEKETIGLYLTSHPLVYYGRELDSLTQPEGFNLAKAQDAAEQSTITVGCMISSVRTVITKKGSKMAMLTIEDLTGKCDAVAFPKTYEEFQEFLQPEKMVFLHGSVEKRNDRSQIVINDVIPIEESIEMLAGTLIIRLPAGKVPKETLDELKEVLQQHKGTSPVFFEVRPQMRTDVSCTIRPGKEWSIQPTRPLVDKIVALLGQENMKLRPKPMKAPAVKGGRQKFYKGKGQENGKPASEAVTRFN